MDAALVLRHHRAGELVVDADAQDIVGDVRAVAAGGERSARSNKRRCERAGYIAKVDIKVLELGGPVAADHAFHTRTDSPAHLQGAIARARRERGNGRAIDPLWAGDVVAADGVGDADFAVGQTARRVDEERRNHGAADAAPNRSKPVETFRKGAGHREGWNVEGDGVADVSHGASAVQDGSGAARADGAAVAGLPGGLDVRLQAEYPSVSLPVVSDLTAADDAVHFEFVTGRIQGAAGPGIGQRKRAV